MLQLSTGHLGEFGVEVSNRELGACGQPCGRIRCYSLQKTTFQAGKAKRAYILKVNW